MAKDKTLVPLIYVDNLETTRMCQHQQNTKRIIERCVLTVQKTSFDKILLFKNCQNQVQSTEEDEMK